jgi:hypothetical protein
MMNEKLQNQKARRTQQRPVKLRNKKIGGGG